MKTESIIMIAVVAIAALLIGTIGVKAALGFGLVIVVAFAAAEAYKEIPKRVQE